jgi:hypothetical protein
VLLVRACNCPSGLAGRLTALQVDSTSFSLVTRGIDFRGSRVVQLH